MQIADARHTSHTDNNLPTMVPATVIFRDEPFSAPPQSAQSSAAETFAVTDAAHAESYSRGLKTLELLQLLNSNLQCIQNAEMLNGSSSTPLTSSGTLSAELAPSSPRNVASSHGFTTPCTISREPSTDSLIASVQQLSLGGGCSRIVATQAIQPASIGQSLAGKLQNDSSEWMASGHKHSYNLGANMVTNAIEQICTQNAQTSRERGTDPFAFGLRTPKHQTSIQHDNGMSFVPIQPANLSRVENSRFGITNPTAVCVAPGSNIAPISTDAGLISFTGTDLAHISTMHASQPSFIPSTPLTHDMLAAAAAFQAMRNEQFAQQARMRHFFAPPPIPHYEECLVGMGGAYQNYCYQIITDPLNACVLRMLNRLKHLQLSDPPAVARMFGKRYYCSLKEVAKVVGSARMLIVAPDVRPSPSAHVKPLRLLQTVLAAATAANVPFVFALSRRGIGQVFGRDKSMSIVAVMNLDQVEADYVNMLDMAHSGREAFRLHPSFPTVI